MEEIKMNVRNKQLDGSTEVSEVTFTDDNEVEAENSVEPAPGPGPTPSGSKIYKHTLHQIGSGWSIFIFSTSSNKLLIENSTNIDYNESLNIISIMPDARLQTKRYLIYEHSGMHSYYTLAYEQIDFENSQVKFIDENLQQFEEIIEL